MPVFDPSVTEYRPYMIWEFKVVCMKSCAINMLSCIIDLLQKEEHKLRPLIYREGTWMDLEHLRKK